MAHDVFISYSSNDKTIADAVTARLESKQIRCWIAPRDILPGQAYAGSLVDAVQNAKVFVLIFSSKSNKSQHVLREVGEAVDTGIPIIPFRIDDVQPSTEMRYYIKSLHWLDAITPPLDHHIDMLANNIASLLGTSLPETPSIEKTTVEKTTSTKTPSKKSLLTIGISGIVVVAMIVLFFMFRSPSNQDITFTNFDTTLWIQIDTTSFLALGQHVNDALLRSDNLVDGDFILTFSATILEDPLADDAGNVGVFVFGNGSDNSDQSLLINFGNGYNIVWRKNAYEDKNQLYVATGKVFEIGKTYHIIITSKNNILNVSVDGSSIINFEIPSDIEQKGHITFWKYWASNSIKYENIELTDRIK